MFGLDDKYIFFIKETFKKYIKNPDAKIYVFGSRVNEKFKEYSDIDIAIDDETMTDKTMLMIQLEFENSTLPYEVDVVDLKKVSDEFKKNITLVSFDF